MPLITISDTSIPLTIMKVIRKKMTWVIFALVALILVFVVKSPSNDANWQTQVKILPTISLDGDVIAIKNVRDFRYVDDGSIAHARYLDQEYQLSKFVQAWYGISHFGPHGLAHVFMSFEFSDDQFLVVSIEARLEEKQVKYSPLKGLARAYTKTIVLATEQDVIGLRTHIRREPVYLYKLEVPELYTKPLLLNFLREAQVLTREPTFYNTIADNCLTGLLAQSDQFRSVFSWMDTRILLPGNSDEIAYDLAYIDNSGSLEQIRERALIKADLVNVADENFSRKIRAQ